ncbi:cysteine hydrolase family protein [Streptomyces sp. NPDC001725]|uniref:cysteine hydrolase family protein n=1 Tax=Streptomyces sp. NPDC001725 TaxID=3156652 RepID=UPI00332A4D97
MSETFRLDPAKTALVLIEYQNDFTSEGGALNSAVSGVMEKTGMLTNTVALVGAARAAGVTIMHAPITFAPGYGELSRTPYGILKGVVDGSAFVKGTWGAAIVDDLAPAEGDIVIEGKRGLDTFAGKLSLSLMCPSSPRSRHVRDLPPRPGEDRTRPDRVPERLHQ